MQKLFTAIFFTVFLCGSLAAQDKHLTQFYAAPLTLNPALTGAFEGHYRVGTIYRDQWRRVLDNPFKSFAVGADLRFPIGSGKVREDAMGLGLQFVNDKTGVIDFSTTQIALSMAYHKSLGNANRQFLSVGLQGGLTQRNINYSSLQFHDAFDGSTGYTLGTGEQLPENNFAFTDLNIGINYTSQIGRYGRIFLGAGMHHILEPKVSFFPNSAQGDKLYRKISAQVAATLPISKDNRVSFLPRVLIATQGPHLEINAGGNFRVAMGQGNSTAVHLGSWVRPVRNTDGIGLDAVVALLGLEFSNVLVGMSYDLNLQALGAKQRQGSFELSVAYLGDYENDGIICPKF